MKRIFTYIISVIALSITGYFIVDMAIHLNDPEPRYQMKFNPTDSCLWVNWYSNGELINQYVVEIYDSANITFNLTDYENN